MKKLESLNSSKFQLKEEDLSFVKGGRHEGTTTTTRTGTTSNNGGMEDSDTTTTTCECDPCGEGVAAPRQLSFSGRS